MPRDETQVVDERVRSGEEGFVAGLDGLAGNGRGQEGLAPATTDGRAQIAALLGEAEREAGARQGMAQRWLDGEVELLGGLQPWEAGLVHAALEAGLGALGNFLAREVEQEFAEGSVLALDGFDENGIGATGAGQMQALERGG